ncbi:MAG: DUF1848 domain-containing protein [Spirochaetaceae bacterium]|nr:DUF1848 domain-containing protein [Spirochaetaceae bacterium]
MTTKKPCCGKIISVSRRTDVPAYFSEWFFNCLKEGYVEVLNPYNQRQIRYVPLLPDHVQGFVFWSKNPRPMLDKLNLLSAYPYYFLFTLNPYGSDIEVNLPPKHTIIDTFKTLSDALGRERVIWRYDPVLFSDTIGIDFHIKSFEETAKQLSAYTGKVIFSYMDCYKKTETTLKTLRIKTPHEEQKMLIAENFSRIAQSYRLEIESCAENIDLAQYNIARARCVDPALFGRPGGKPPEYIKDKSQREFCGCTCSVDIGLYRSCRAGCVYCYAK